MVARRLTLYSTLGCHLCEEALAIVRPLLQAFDLELLECDIADSEALLAAYGVRIPVVKLEGATGDLGWPFTTAELTAYLENPASDAH